MAKVGVVGLGRLTLSRREDIGQEIDHPDVDPRLFPGMMVAEENAELVDDPFYRAFIIAVRALESPAGCAR